MSEIKSEIAKIFLKGRESNKALQEHIRFDRRLDEAELNLEGLRANKETPSKQIVEASSKLSDIESEIEKKVVFDHESIKTPEEYNESLIKLSEEYFELVSNNHTDFQDVVFQVKSFDPLTTAKLDKITEDFEEDSLKIKRIIQSEFKGLSSFDSNHVFVMPISELDDFIAILNNPENDLKCVQNPFFFVNHLNQDVPTSKMESVLTEKYNNSKIESFFAKELGLYVCPLENRKVKGQRLPDVVNAFKEILEQEGLESEYGNPKISPSIKSVNIALKYPETKELVTVLSESKILDKETERVESDLKFQKQIEENCRKFSEEPKSTFRNIPKRM